MPTVTRELSDSDRLDFMRRRLEIERETLFQSIRSELHSLRDKLVVAFDALESGARLDAHLVANSVMLTELIARWNLTRDMCGYEP